MIRSTSKMAVMLLMSISLAGISIFPAAGDTEPNDSFGAAEWVTAGTWHTGASGPTDMKDFYKLNLSTGQYCNINCMVGMYSPRYTFSLYDPEESLLKTSGVVETYTSCYLNYTLGQSGAGRYYLVAEVETCSTNQYGSYGFQLYLYNQSDGGKAGDAGDTIDTARQLGEGSSDGRLGDRDKADHYKFSAPGGFMINSTLTAGTAGDSPLSMTLYRSGGAVLDSTGWLSPGASAVVRHTTSDNAPGDYILSVCQTAGGGNNYTVSLSIRPQNDAGSGKDAPASYLRALSLPGSGKYTGWMAGDDAADAYNISLAGGQMIDCTLEAGRTGSEKLELALLRPDGDGLFTISATPGGSSARGWILNSTGGGIFHPVISGRNSYDLTIVISDQGDGAAAGDAGETIDAARPVIMNYNYSGLLGADDGADCYSFNGKATQPVTANFLMTNATGQGHVILYGPSNIVLMDSPGTTIGVPVSNRVTLVSDGTHYLVVLGGRMDYVFNITTPPDTSPPVLNITYPGEGEGSILPEITVTGTASDLVGVVVVQISRDNSTWANCTGTTTWSGKFDLVEGPNLIHVRARDVAGNMARATRLVFFDKRSPVLNVSYPPDRSYLHVPWVEVRGNASDNLRITVVEVSLDGARWVAANGTTSWSLANITLAEGTNTISVRALDPAGNNDTWRVRVTVDTQLPQVSVAYPANGSWLNNNTVELGGAASDNILMEKVEVSLTGGSWRAATILPGDQWSLAGFALKPGANNITVRATDMAGNSARKTLLLNVDNEPPVVFITSPTDGKKVDRNRLVVRGTSSDNMLLSGLKLKVNGEDVPVTGTAGWMANITLWEGKNTILATATDVANNTQSATITVTYEKAKSQPGFGAFLLVTALAVGLALLAKKRNR